MNPWVADGDEPPFDRAKPTHGEVKTELFYCVLSYPYPRTNADRALVV